MALLKGDSSRWALYIGDGRMDGGSMIITVIRSKTDQPQGAGSWFWPMLRAGIMSSFRV